MKSKRLESISVRNSIRFIDVMEIYGRFNYRLYKRRFAKEGKISIYQQDLEDQTFKLTERYFDMFRLKEIKNGE